MELEGCFETVYNFGKDFGYSRKEAERCIKETATRVGITDLEVCKHLAHVISVTANNAITQATKSNLPLKQYQEKAVRHMLFNRGLILSFDVGSGKTLTAVVIASVLRKQARMFGRNLQVVIVTPTSLQENFKKEMRAYGEDPSKSAYSFYTIAGFVNAIKAGKTDCGKDTLLIVDEAHNIRTDYRGEFGMIRKRGGSAEKSRALSFVRCAAKSWKVLLLTATPAYNDVHDIVNLVAMVKKMEVPLTKGEFNALLNSDRAFDDYFGCVFAFHTPIDRSEFPNRRDIYEYIPMTPEVHRQYNMMEFDQPGAMDLEKSNAFQSRLRQASNNIPPCLKCQVIMRLLEEGEKTIVYSEFKSSGIELVEKLLDEKSIPYYTITGNVPKEKRNKIVQDMNSGGRSKPKILFISEAGGEGLDLKGVRKVIIFEGGWNKSSEEQVIGRAVRYRSHTHLPQDERLVTVYHLLLVKPREMDIDKSSPENYMTGGRQEKELSADLWMHGRASIKKIHTDNLIARLKKIDIENSKKCIH